MGKPIYRGPACFTYQTGCLVKKKNLCCGEKPLREANTGVTNHIHHEPIAAP